jgi:hypothetical protein
MAKEQEILTNILEKAGNMEIVYCLQDFMKAYIWSLA